jgi:hypothetical protein
MKLTKITIDDVLAFYHSGKIKLGLDFHGVINKAPAMFVDLAKEVRRRGGEVHVLTGSPDDAALDRDMRSFNGGKRWWDYIFSITDHLLAKGIPYKIDAKGGKVFPDSEWDSAKAEYCESKGITVHIDDSETFLSCFMTPCLLYVQE